MTHAAYVLSKGAVADLREITRYTIATWGEERCRTYVAEIETTASALARGEGVYREMDVVLPGLRMAWSGKHCLFCLPRPGQRPIILAILHERMDILARLKDRLL
ncbi:MAG: type II toxin-antitoxin system RelE/ParE family toxin [Burkholderiaceae bacterium]